MTDDATYFGTDTARYQPDGTYNPGAFERINFQDPQRDQKLARNTREARPSGIYLWIYAGHDVYVDTAHMVDTMRAVLGHDPELGYSADYEDAGITPSQLTAFFAALDDRHAHGDYYSGPSALDHTPFLGRDWWNAAYPTGQVAFPGYGALWASSRPRPMTMWQYTSAGGLDRDVVVDDAWYLARVVTKPAPLPIVPEDTMLYSTTDNGTTTYYRDAGGVLIALAPAEAAVYYTAITSGKVVVIGLGGVLAAIAYNQNTLKARTKLGV